MVENNINIDVEYENLFEKLSNDCKDDFVDILPVSEDEPGVLHEEEGKESEGEREEIVVSDILDTPEDKVQFDSAKDDEDKNDDDVMDDDDEDDDDFVEVPFIESNQNVIENFEKNPENCTLLNSEESVVVSDDDEKEHFIHTPIIESVEEKISSENISLEVQNELFDYTDEEDEFVCDDDDALRDNADRLFRHAQTTTNQCIGEAQVG